jgi:hypothetical protein
MQSESAWCLSAVSRTYARESSRGAMNNWIQSVFVVTCPCGVAIPLPPQSPLGIFQPPTPRPSQRNWPANFECSHCGRWFSRSAQETHLVENASLFQSLRGESFWRVELRCGHPRCEQNISTYTTMPDTSSPSSVGAFVRANSGLKCPDHGLIGQPSEPTSVERFPYLFRLGI